jgi:GT2 family glycosyltransferase
MAVIDPQQDHPELEKAQAVPLTAAFVAPKPETGFIDMYGYAGSLSGWFFCGWIGRRDGPLGAEATDFIARFEEGEVTGTATVAYFKRDDIKDRGGGVLIRADIEAPPAWDLRQLSLSIGGAEFKANGGARSRKLTAADLVSELKPIVRDRLARGKARQVLTTMLSRVYVGEDTLASLAPSVRLEIDDAIVCPPDGLLLIGWRLFTPGVVKSMRARCGALSREIRFEDCLPIARPDVTAADPASQLEFQDARCGFAAFLPHGLSAGEPPYLEVETCDGEVAFRPILRSPLTGLAAIRRLLHDADVRFNELDDVFDQVIGPAVAALNTERLATPASVATIEFGAIPDRPRCSIIVPLFGRIDFLEYQMALFSANGAHAEAEFIYVLDDPPRRRELENLAQSVFARFEIPFRLLLLPQNLGFAPANNHGLRSARGEFVCFLNSDVFPGTPNWIERLTADLAQHADIGVIGPRLLFEDGSIQHEGCIYRPLQEFGGWIYVDHDHRGRRPGPERGLRKVPAITGACMVMRRRLAEELGGFDEAFIIGDFEDSDLCKKVLARGLTCAVDRDIHLYHLERKSQAGSVQPWRQNLTLYNAWVHQRRWYPAGAT